ncbi:MAG: hypothetical protein RR066_03290 [Mucinivorans sp.]
MKQATGSNRGIETRELSIQIALDGFSFYVMSQDRVLAQRSFEGIALHDALEQMAFSYGPLEVTSCVWHTANMVAVPTEIFENSLCDRYIELAGKAPGCCCTVSIDNVTVVWTVEPEMMEQCQVLMPVAVHHHQVEYQLGSEGLILDLFYNIACITYQQQGKLRVAQSVQVTNSADVLYFLKSFAPEASSLTFSGIDMFECRAVLQNFYHFNQ